MAKPSHALLADYMADYVRERADRSTARWDHDRRALDAPPRAVTLDDVVRDPYDGDAHPGDAQCAWRPARRAAGRGGRSTSTSSSPAGTGSISPRRPAPPACARSILTRERVDGGVRSFEGLTDRQRDAARDAAPRRGGPRRAAGADRAPRAGGGPDHRPGRAGDGHADGAGQGPAGLAACG